MKVYFAGAIRGGREIYERDCKWLKEETHI